VKSALAVLVMLGALAGATTTRTPIAIIPRNTAPGGAYVVAESGLIAAGDSQSPGSITLYKIGTWDYLATLSFSDPNGTVSGIAITNGYIAVGVADGPVGNIEVFTPTGGVWQDQTSSVTLSGSDGQIGSPAAWGSVLVAVSEKKGYVFIEPKSGWRTGTESAQLTGLQGNANFYSTAMWGEKGLGGDVIALGAINGTRGIYVYQKPTAGWTDMTPTAILTDSEEGLVFAEELSIGNGIIATSDGVPGTGDLNTVSLYVEPQGGWQSTSSPSYRLEITDKRGGTDSASITQSGEVVVSCCGETWVNQYELGSNQAYLWRSSNEWEKFIILSTEGLSNELSAAAVTEDYALAVDGENGTIYVFDGK
jgi:hypothetical protein